MIRAETGRKCAICGKSRTGSRAATFGAAMELRRLGIKGDKVHMDCLRDAMQRAALNGEERHG